MRVILETPRLILREFNPSDAPLFYELNSDPEVVRYVGEPVLTSADAALAVMKERIFLQYEKYNLGRLAAELKASGEFLGWCGIKFIPEKEEYDLGYRFSRKYWGKGYGTESAKAALEFGHREMKIGKITGKALIENTNSIRILKKIGMKFVKNETEHDGECAVYISERFS
jgi:ribosomal-protein-alanine N-acetyltransferase